MKLLSWNINGLRSMKKGVRSILSDLDCDVVCFQETKISRDFLVEDTAIVDGYSSYFSFPKNQSGYSGVATYCSLKCTPKYAKEGLTQFISPDEKFEQSFSEVPGLVDLMQESDLPALDSEGRVITTHHELEYDGKREMLSVINVYCPRVDPEKPERQLYKMQFCHLLDTKANFLLRQGCHVAILGDLNIAHHTIDHCDPGDEEEFNAKETRLWLTSFVEGSNDSESLFVDAFRHFHAGRTGAYTCWNTKTGARQTNYGTRIDYIIVSRSLLPLITFCDICPDVYGSDHCPVMAVLNCQAVPSKSFPAICTRNWPEFSGKQQNITAFLKKGPDLSNGCSTVDQPAKRKKLQASQKTIKNFFVTNQSSDNTKKLSSETVLDHKICNTNPRSGNSVPGIVSSTESFTQPVEHSELNNFNVQLESSEIKEKQTIQWKAVLRGPPKPPLCKGHNKPCVLRTVRKDGPNYGRQFFSCAQPDGHPSNPESRCSFFQWVTAPKKNRLEN